MNIKQITKQNGATVYRAKLYLGIDQMTGKKVKKSLTAKTKKELKQKALQAQIAFESNGSTVSKVVKVRNYQELADLWLESYKNTVTPQTYRYTLGLLKTHLLPTLGAIKVEKITPYMVQGLANDLSKKLVNYKLALSVNNRVLKFAVSLQLISHNPARDIMLPKLAKNKPQKVRYIPPENLKIFLEQMEELAQTSYVCNADYTFFSLLLATGCRYGEAIALDWSDIDLEHGTISVTKNYSQEVKRLGKTKTKSGQRQISIDPKTIKLLKLYKVRQGQLFRELEATSDPVTVFSTPNRQYLDRVACQKRLDGYCQRFALPRFTFHAFRHTHASLLLNAGIGYKELQHRLGHSNINMTLDVYAHLSKEREKEAINYYQKALGNL